MTLRMLVAMMMAACPAAAADDRAVRYEFGDRGDVRIVTDVAVTAPGTREWRHPLAPGSRSSDARVIDRATGRALKTRIEGGDLVVDLGRALPADAEHRLGVEESDGAGALRQRPGRWRATRVRAARPRAGHDRPAARLHGEPCVGPGAVRDRGRQTEGRHRRARCAS